MNHAVFGKTIEHAQKHRKIKYVTNVEGRKYLFSKANFHHAKWFSVKYVNVDCLDHIKNWKVMCMTY